MKISVVLEAQPEGGFTSYIPTLPGCVSEGETEKEAKKNLLDALEGYLTVVVERGVDGRHVSRCPSLKGCWSQGRSRDEALANMKEAIRLHLDGGAKKLRPSSRRKIFDLSL